MRVYTFEDFTVGTTVVNDHEVVVVEVIAKGDKYTSGRIKASVDGGKARLYRLGDLCEALGVEAAKVRTGRTSGTKVVSTKTEEDRIEAKARLAYKDATKGLEAMEAAGLLSGKALANAKKELEAKIKAEQKRLTAEAVAAKAKKAEEQATKKVEKAAARMFEKAAKALDVFPVAALQAFLKVYIDTREDAKAIMEVVTKAQELDDARNNA
jgi:hypothetical protein